MKIGITGSSGFIGKRLTKKLEEDKDEAFDQEQLDKVVEAQDIIAKLAIEKERARIHGAL